LTSRLSRHTFNILINNQCSFTYHETGVAMWVSFCVQELSSYPMSCPICLILFKCLWLGFVSSVLYGLLEISTDKPMECLPHGYTWYICNGKRDHVVLFIFTLTLLAYQALPIH